METHIEWTSPAPLWDEFAGRANADQRRTFRTPAILRFSSDAFMDQFVDLMKSRPEDLKSYLAVPETWRQPSADPVTVERKSAFRAKLDRLRAAAVARALAGGKEIVRSTPWNLPVVRTTSGGTEKAFKLYQPAHERYYMVTASLVCRTMGLPDRVVRTNVQERATFVIRMLDTSANPAEVNPTPEDGHEYALVGNTWVPVGSSSFTLVDGEEQYPLSPMTYADLDDRKRRVFNGLIPVSKREKLIGASMPRRASGSSTAALPAGTSATGPSAPRIDSVSPPAATPGSLVTIKGSRLAAATGVWIAGVAATFQVISNAQLAVTVPDADESGPITIVTPGGSTTSTAKFTMLKAIDTRQMMLKMSVLGPWANLEEIAKLAGKRNEVSPNVEDKRGDKEGTEQAVIDQANDQIQMMSWYILVDFAHWIEDNAESLWQALKNKMRPSGDTRDAYDLITGLVDANPDNDDTTLRDALFAVRVAAVEQQLENAKTLYSKSSGSWPAVRFQFVYAVKDTSPQGVRKSGAALVGKDLREELEEKLRIALPKGESAPVASRSIAETSANDFGARWFTVRCVFERPNCSPMVDAVVSEASASFQLASFFDSDAPARKIRIAMPADTTPAGLRKFDRNTAFVLSDVLCGQVAAIRDLSFADLVLSVLPWPFHKDLDLGGMKPCPQDGGPAAGLVCSMSIPIITVCALILLIIMVKLLDIIFYWMPFFFICLPVPKFDAKKVV